MNSDRATKDLQKRDAFAHWAWCLPVLLVVAHLSLRLIDIFPPTSDEFYSMYNAGLLVGGPYSPFEIIASLSEYSPSHTPAFFFLLSIWGNLTAPLLPIGRILAMCYGLLSLAIVYRLARDFVAPAAGLFAVLFAASNAFYAYYVTEIRMYTLLVIAGGAVLWLYLRILYRCKSAQTRDLVALGAAVYLLVNTHAFSVTFLLSIGIYHLIFVPQDRRWALVAAAVCVPVLLYLPWFVNFLFTDLDRVSSIWSESMAASWDVLARWMAVVTNGQPLLFILGAGGLIVAPNWLRSRIAPLIKLAIIFLIVLWVIADVTTFVSLQSMRFHLAAWHFSLLILAAGYFSFFRKRRRLGAFALLWIVAGISFQNSASWDAYVAGRIRQLSLPPWQVISRMAAETEPQPLLVLQSDYFSVLDWASHIPYSLKEHYFDRKNLGLRKVSHLSELKTDLLNDSIVSPRVWLLYQESKLSGAEISSALATMTELGYSLCNTTKIGLDSVTIDFSWDQLNCQAPVLDSTGQNDLIEHRFYGAAADERDGVLRFVDEWSPRANQDLDNSWMSYQLISSDWANVAQVDLPLVHEGVKRRFSIDLSDIDPGSYRLMAIVYDSESGERIPWQDNAGLVPEMLLLAEVAIP